MENRRIISYVLFVLGIIAFLVIGWSQNQWMTGALVGLALIVVGYIFYRRGK